MSESDSAAPRGSSSWRRLRSLYETSPEVASIALYALTAVVLLFSAYYLIFTTFAAYDDEGTLLVGLRAFLHGETLYKHIYSSYGPFYYELFGAFFKLTGIRLTTDAGRTIVIVVWTTTSLIFGLVAQRITRSLLLGVGGMLVAFLSVGILIVEPMHPQGLCILLMGVLALFTVNRWERHTWLYGALAGAAVAALLLTKINLGIYAIAALAFAAAVTVERLRRIRRLTAAIAFLFLLLPILIVSKNLNEEWVRTMLAVQLGGTLAIVVGAWPQRFRSDDDGDLVVRWLLAAVAGLIVAFLAIVLIALATGPSPADLWSGIITKAQATRDILIQPLATPDGAVIWAVAAVGAAAVTNSVRARGEARPTLWPPVLRVAAGLLIWLTAAKIKPFGGNVAVNPDTLPLVLSWIATIAPAGLQESAQQRFLRVFFPALAAAEALQVFPVAGSQTGIAAILFVPVGAIVIADALVGFRAWAAARGGEAKRQMQIGLSVAAAVFAGALALNYVILPGITKKETYEYQPALPFAGAELLHIEPAQWSELSGVSELLKANECSTFVGYPNVDSFYLWNDLEAPRPQVPDAWMKALSHDEQQEVVDQLKATPHPCGLVNEKVAQAWLDGLPPPPGPLLHYLRSDLQTAAVIGDFKLQLPPGVQVRGVE